MQGDTVRAELAETSGRCNKVNMGDEGVRDRVFQGTQALNVLVAVDIILEVGLQQVIGLLHSRLERHPVGILLDIGDSSFLEPLSDCIHGGSSGLQHALHLIMSTEVLTIVRVIGCRHVQHGLLEPGSVTLGQGNLQLDGLVPAGSS